MIGFHVKRLVNPHLPPAGRAMSSGSLYWRRHMPNYIGEGIHQFHNIMQKNFPQQLHMWLVYVIALIQTLQDLSAQDLSTQALKIKIKRKIA
jgi:hypothetical protein